MATQEINLKLDPDQVADLKQFVRDQIRGERAAVSTPLDGWCEITTLPESGTRRVFIPGVVGEQRVRTAQIELELLQERVRRIDEDLAHLRDPEGSVSVPWVREKLQGLLK